MHEWWQYILLFCRSSNMFLSIHTYRVKPTSWAAIHCTLHDICVCMCVFMCVSATCIDHPSPPLPPPPTRTHSHYHMVGNTTTTDSFIKDSTCYRSFFRCVTIHGTSGVLVQDTVAFDIQGSAYYMESGMYGVVLIYCWCSVGVVLSYFDTLHVGGCCFFYWMHVTLHLNHINHISTTPQPYHARSYPPHLSTRCTIQVWRKIMYWITT